MYMFMKCVSDAAITFIWTLPYISKISHFLSFFLKKHVFCVCGETTNTKLNWNITIAVTSIIIVEHISACWMLLVGLLYLYISCLTQCLHPHHLSYIVFSGQFYPQVKSVFISPILMTDHQSSSIFPMANMINYHPLAFFSSVFFTS